ncbi:M1 family metallopeptidase [Rubrolithibacter danxiaensis]|uniref:M1 family metallopeptidase n=1 Tax=Rubrolithibacter danxiaensis TaxID=3390805 RepID=UPI003BF88678
MNIRKLFYLLLFFLLPLSIFSQPLNQKSSFTRADTLRGMLSTLRSCYDVNFYHLDVKVNIDQKFIAGKNLFKITATQEFDKLQIDLFDNLKIEKITFEDKELSFKREYNAVFIGFPRVIKKDEKTNFTVYYSGNPVVANNAPWDGGFVFTKDKAGKPWVGVACQGLGASSWWPTKDHQSDEPDSMLISIAVPNGLMDVSNGRLRSIEKLDNQYIKYNWFVSNPINNYDVTLNIADYAHFNDEFAGEKGKLSLNYFVLKENLPKAKKQFGENVKPMLKCFEYWFGPYPFYNDGYKLVESPYLGMEHQSAVAYGNGYKNGYRGRDLSGTGLGLKWDYIIVHESGHEWFGNNITSKDIADMWIHEAFTMYSEGLFVKCTEGKDAGARYIAGVRENIENDIPIIGPYNVNKEGSGDMYYKGANMLQTIRSVIDNDEKWREILRGLNKDLGLKTTTTEEVINYMNLKSGKNLTKIFDQYLRYTEIPVLEIKNSKKGLLSYRWKASVTGLNMPVKVKLSNKKEWEYINPATEWKSIKAKSMAVDTINFYIKTKF